MPSRLIHAATVTRSTIASIDGDGATCTQPTCAVSSAPCERPATHALKMVIPDAGVRAHHAEGFLGIHLCGQHSEEAEAWAFINENPAMLALMQAMADGDAKLDVDEAYVAGVPIGSPEYKAWRELECRVN